MNLLFIFGTTEILILFARIPSSQKKRAQGDSNNLIIEK